MKKFVSTTLVSAMFLSQLTWAQQSVYHDEGPPKRSAGENTATAVVFLAIGKKLGWQRGAFGYCLGGATMFTALSKAMNANAAPLSEDSVKEIQKSREYAELEQSIGKAKAREFVLDLKAGWSLEAMEKKYGFKIADEAIANDKDKAKAAGIVAGVDSSAAPAASSAVAK